LKPKRDKLRPAIALFSTECIIDAKDSKKEQSFLITFGDTLFCCFANENRKPNVYVILLATLLERFPQSQTPDYAIFWFDAFKFAMLDAQCFVCRTGVFQSYALRSEVSPSLLFYRTFSAFLVHFIRALH